MHFYVHVVFQGIKTFNRGTPALQTNMLRLALLLLCTSQTLTNVSGSHLTFGMKKRINPKKFDFNASESEKKEATPSGVIDLNLSGLKDSTKAMGIELPSPHEEVSSPKGSSRPRKSSFSRACGTPLNDLLEKIPSNSQFYSEGTTLSQPLLVKAKSSSDIEEEESESGYEYEYESENDFIDSQELKLKVEARRNDALNSAYESQERSADVYEIAETLGNMMNNVSSPAIATVALSLADKTPNPVRILDDRVEVETVCSSDSEYEGLISRLASVDSDAEELNLGSAPKKPAARSVDSPVRQVNTSTVKASASTVNASASTVNFSAAASAVNPLTTADPMKYRSIDSVVDLGIRERMALSVSLHNQIAKSEKFQSPIKFADMPQGVFMHKISLSVRRYRKTLLTREEMECSDVLIRVILDCNMSLEDFYDVIELLKRAGRDYASAKLVSRVLVPKLIKMHKGKDEANAEKMEISVLNRLALYGNVLLLNDLLKHNTVGKALRSHLSLDDIQYLLMYLINNGTITDEEITECMKLLMKGYDFEEFKASELGKELIKVCEINRKGLI